MVLTRGQFSPYDTAVAIALPQYRLEGRKIRLGQALIDSLGVEIENRIVERDHADSLNVNLKTENAIIAARLNERGLTINQLNANYEKLYLQATKPKRFFEDPWKLGPAAFIVGMITANLSRR